MTYDELIALVHIRWTQELSPLPDTSGFASYEDFRPIHQAYWAAAKRIAYRVFYEIYGFRFFP